MDINALKKTIAIQSRLGKELAKAVKPIHLDFSMPSIPKLPAFSDDSLASGFHERLIKMTKDFEESLDNEHEVGVKLANFSQSVVIHVTNIGYWNPHLITFTGSNEKGEKVELIQHTSQINVLLLKVKRLDLSKPKTRIGFVGENEDIEEI